MFAVVITGCSWSVTFTVCAAVEVFPWMSVTVQVIVVVPTGNVFPVGTPVRVTVNEQLSCAVGLPSVASSIKSPQSVAPAPVFSVSPVGAVIVGFSWSLTVTSCVAVEPLPCTSIAVQVTVVIPFGNGLTKGCPSLRTPPRLPTPQLSATVVPRDTLPVHAPGSVELVMFEAAIAGTSMSKTVTVNVELADPQLFVAVAVTVVVPTGKAVPGFLEYVTVGAGVPVAV